jgi:hypothetical protein
MIKKLDKMKADRLLDPTQRALYVSRLKSARLLLYVGLVLELLVMLACVICREPITAVFSSFLLVLILCVNTEQSIALASVIDKMTQNKSTEPATPPYSESAARSPQG